MDAKYLLAKLRAGQLLGSEQARAADVLWDLMKSCGIIKPDDPIWQRPSTAAPVGGMPWCDYCQCYHAPRADHIGKTYDGYSDPKG